MTNLGLNFENYGIYSFYCVFSIIMKVKLVYAKMRLVTGSRIGTGTRLVADLLAFALAKNRITSKVTVCLSCFSYAVNNAKVDRHVFSAKVSTTAFGL